MPHKLLTRTEVADLLGVREENVLRMAEHGVLPKPIMIGEEPHFPDEVIMRIREEEDEAVPSAGVYLAAARDIIYFKIVKASHTVIYNNCPFAAFTLWGGSLHIRPWLTHVVDDLPDHENILLSCEDEDIPEVKFEDLPEPASVTWGYSWVGQVDLEDEDDLPNGNISIQQVCASSTDSALSNVTGATCPQPAGNLIASA